MEGKKRIERQHRDFGRSNKANKAVQGYAYATISSNYIDSIIAVTEKKDDTENDRDRKVKSLLKVLKQSNELSKNLLMASQNNINQRHCKTINSKINAQK